MRLTDLSINRPVFAIALSLMIVVIGILSSVNLSLQRYPSVEEPILTITTFYPGAAPSIIESKITSVLEDSLSSTPGLDYMESSSKSGQSIITLHFREAVSMDTAASDAREHIGRVRTLLPRDCFDPTISKTNSNTDAFMYLVLTNPTFSELELYDYANHNLKPLFESLPNVSKADIYGSSLVMQVMLDREKLKAHDIAVTDVIQTLTQGSLELPAGSIIKGKRYVNVVVNSGLNSPQDLSKLVLKNTQEHLVYLKDVATITLQKDANEFEVRARYNKGDVVFIALHQMTGANILEISQKAGDLIKSLKETFPKGMELKSGYNLAVFVEASIKAVTTTIFEAFVLVLLIIFLFLHSLRASFIPLITIPVSLIGAFFFLFAFGCSINTLTLLAMVLAIGLVVDDAIVVLENIHRYIEDGLTPLEAARKGASEVSFAVIAMTLTLVSVYAPLAFMQGLTGKLFSEFAVALGGSVLISGLVALTLSPMMCARLLTTTHAPSQSKLIHLLEDNLEALHQSYHRALVNVLNYPKILLGSLICVFVACLVLFTKLPSELAPLEDEGLVFASVQGPSGATLETMENYVTQLENVLSSIPEANEIFMVVQRSSVFGGVTLKPWHQRKRSVLHLLPELNQKAAAIPGFQTTIFPPSGLLTGGQFGFEFAIKTTNPYEVLEKETDGVLKKVKNSPYFQYIDQDLHLRTPQLMVQIDRNKAAILGIRIEDISRTLETMLSGNRSLKFERKGKHYDIVVQSQSNQRKDLRDIGSFYVRSMTSNTLIPLSHIISLEEIAVPDDLKHLNKMRSAALKGNLNPGYHMGAAFDFVTQTARETLPTGFQEEPLGILRKFTGSQADIYLIFFAALFFIYLVLAIQFESFLDPLLIMITVPLSIGGGLLALFLTQGSLNIYSQVGLITLVGLITKHGILLVEFANKQQEKGLSAREAILKAASLRLRPILMTTGAMVLGAIPLALASGAGAESRQQIGWVLVGGLMTGTLLTLFAVPFVYIQAKSQPLSDLFRKGLKVILKKKIPPLDPLKKCHN